VFDQLRADPPKRQFTVGIVDDVTHHSLSVDDSFRTDNARLRAVFYGLGADGTVSANKSSVKLVAQHAGLRAQGYFVYDSKKSGSTTTSHLRFDPERIDSPYLIADADFVGVHQFGLFDQIDMLAVARPGATLLINSPYDDARTWAELPDDVKDAIVDKNLSVSVIDAHRVAREAGLSGQINTVMQVCFFALVDLLPMVDALEAVKASVRRSYGKRGGPVVAANITAIDATLVALRSLTIPSLAVDPRPRRLSVPAQAPDFVQRVTAMMLAGRGDLLPVSAMPVDGVFPTGTAQYEKRRLASELPIWDSSICIDCARCALVCPHAAIRMKVLPEAELVPEVLATKPFRSKDHAGLRLTIQVSPEDCTGCGVCVDMCPARDKTSTRHKALDMEPFADHVAVEMARWEVFQEIVGVPDGLLDPATPKGSQARRPMFEFSGACAGCGETPYLKLLTQLYGDHLIVANATGCSSIYGGNLPTTPWTSGPEGRGPAWANSLFEDNAEFGLGMRIALDGQADAARSMLTELMPSLDLALVTAILALDPHDRWSDAEFAEQRARIAKLDADLAALSSEQGSLGATARRLASITSALVRRSVWIVGGDGWAYDIGSAGLDHVLASGRNVNILVLDTEVYSNTGGQASKSSPRGAVAKFAAAGKATAKKDLGAEAVRYGGVYVAQIAIGANDTQAVKAFAEAEAWPGPSLIIAYSTCIAHGIDMSRSMSHQRDAVKSGYWPLYRFRPGGDEHAHPFQLDSNAPSMPVAEFVASEGRFAQLERSDPERSRLLLGLAQRDVDERWRYYQQLAGVERTDPELGGPDAV
jgi:pyruvate-ferredoxin/flavodoxin oxidoreductase